MEIGEKLDGIAHKVEARVELVTFANHELATAEETRVCQAACHVDGCVACSDPRTELCKEGCEDGKGDWLDWVPVPLAMVLLDTSDELLD